jgi:hypothetical protein
MHANNGVYLWEDFAYARRRWQRRGGLTGILGGISILRPRGLARENDDKAAEVEVLNRDGV